MRTTLTLDSDIAQKLKEKALRERRSFKDVVNETLRIGLDPSGAEAAAEARFVVKPHHCGFRTGVDAGRLNQLVDEFDE